VDITLTSLQPTNDRLNDDQLRIDTPEQIQLEFPLAGIGSRFLAIFIDTLLQSLVYVAAIVIALTAAPYLKQLANPRTFRWLSPTWAAAIVVFIVFGAYWGYFAFFEIIWKGQTPGKRFVKIRVIKESGRPINAYEAIARNLLRAVDMMPTMYIAGLVTMMISPRNKRLGDYVAGSVVVHEKLPELLRPDWSSASEPSSNDSSLSKITPNELVLVETYLQRRWDLDSTVRSDTGYKIASLITAKTGIARAPEQSLDDFLEAVARQVRDSARLR
jgi:uncharacterized RDD family membrane protein YckC